MLIMSEENTGKEIAEEELTSAEKTESLSLKEQLDLYDPDKVELGEEVLRFAKEDRKRKIVKSILLILFSVIILVSGTKIVTTLIGYKKAEDSYDEIQKLFYEGIETDAKNMIAESEPPLPSFGMKKRAIDSSELLYRQFKGKISALKADYPDIYGWILMPGMEHIDYPVMQSEDNYFFLHHDWQGRWLEAGAIFADFNCSKHVTENRNTVLYGHNMLNGMMFSDLTKFTSKEIFDANPYIYLFTLDGVYTYTIFSFYKTDYRSGYIETYFPTTESLIDFAENSRANSLFYRDGVTFDANTRLITLSTCTDIVQTDRYCLQAVLTGIME